MTTLKAMQHYLRYIRVNFKKEAEDLEAMEGTSLI